jgi:hypothetical protein
LVAIRIDAVDNTREAMTGCPLRLKVARGALTRPRTRICLFVLRLVLRVLGTRTEVEVVS